MTEESRQMWTDLYRFYERCEKIVPGSAEWKNIGAEANKILAKYGEENFLVRDVLATTMSWFLMKGETNE